MMPVDTSPQHDLGVLFVHGIGDQPQASTLVEFGTPLVEWLRERARLEGCTVDVASTLLKPLEDEPAHSEVRFTGAGEARSWLLAESWWAETFRVPQYRELARWSISVVPWTFGTHFGRRLWRAWHAPADGLSAQAMWVLRVIGSFVALLGGIVLSLVMLVALSVLLVLGLIPWQRLRNAILRVQLSLASSIGDSFILVGRPIEGAAILSRFRRDLAWLSSRCRRVAVVAHSQGGAVATLGVDSVDDDRIRLLFTFGSGLRKLQELAELQETRSFRRGASLTLLGLLLTALSALSAPRVIPEISTGEFPLWDLWWVPLYAASGLILLAAGIADFVGGPEPDRLVALVDRLRERRLSWMDAYATADPVSNGRLHDDPALPPETIEVTNRGSMLADHTTYWWNRDEFVARVAEALLASDEAPPVPPLGAPVLAYLSRRRRIRVRFLQTIGWVGVVSALALLVRYWPDWSAVLAWSITAAADQVASAFGGSVGGAALPDGAVWGRSVGWLSLIIAGRLAAGALWNRLDALENEQPPPFRYRGPMRVVVALAIAFQLLFLMLAIQDGALQGWLSTAILAGGLVLGVAWEVTQPPVPETMCEAARAYASSARRTMAERAGRIIWNLVTLGAVLIAGPLGLVALVRWMRDTLAQVLGVTDLGWGWAFALLLAAFLVLTVVLRGIVWLLVRRRAVSEVPVQTGE